MVGYKIVDDFLPKNIFDKMVSDLGNLNLKWEFFPCNPPCASEKTYFYFSHMVYWKTIENERTLKVITPILDKLNIKALIRVKMNLYTRTESIDHHDGHGDFDWNHNGGVFSLNTCDGFTVIDGEEIPSVANRMLFFDPSIMHHSTNCTNDPCRMNINFNYF